MLESSSLAYSSALSDVIGYKIYRPRVLFARWTTRESTKQITQRTEDYFAIVQWEDTFANIIQLENIKSPKKPQSQYKEGEYVTAYFGKKVYKARISEISRKYSLETYTSVHLNFFTSAILIICME